MACAFKAIFAAGILMVGLAAPVAAGPYEDALAAYNRGDYMIALLAFRSQADQGSVKSQFALALMYYEGRGVQQSYAEALGWYRRAAEQGFADAQAVLGLMYFNGQGTPYNYVTAYMWLKIASDRGNSMGTTELNNIAKLMTPTQIAEGQRLAREWKPKP